MIDYLKFGQGWLVYYAIQEKDWSNSGEYSLHSLKAFKFIESVYMLHINILRYMDMLPRYHLVGYTGTVLHWTIRYRMLYLRQATQGTHNLWGGYSFTWCDTELAVTGRSPSSRLPLTRAHTIREEAAPCYEDILNSPLQGTHPQAGYPLHRAHTIREEAAPYYEDIL